MNIENILKLRDFIDSLPAKRFDINVWANTLADNPEVINYDATSDEVLHNCGTCACIGGWADVLFQPKGFLIVQSDGYINTAEQLGLDTDTAYDLTHPSDVAWSLVTKDVAVEVLTILAETGRVDYKKAIANVTLQA